MVVRSLDVILHEQEPKDNFTVKVNIDPGFILVRDVGVGGNEAKAGQWHQPAVCKSDPNQILE